MHNELRGGQKSNWSGHGQFRLSHVEVRSLKGMHVCVTYDTCLVSEVDKKSCASRYPNHQNQSSSGQSSVRHPMHVVAHSGASTPHNASCIQPRS